MLSYYKFLSAALLFSVTIASVNAEEIELKNGTKFTGTIVAVEGDVFRVKMPYGEIRIPRTDMAKVSFPDTKSASAPVQKDPGQVDETLSGTDYTNRTAGFQIVVPAGWVLASELRANQPDIVAALKSPDQSQFLAVTPEKFVGNLTTYEVFCETQYQSKFQDYKRLEKSEIQVDGRPGIRLVFQAVAPNPHITIKFLVYIVQYEDKMVRLSFWTLEPLFDDSLPVFEKIAHSYRLHKPVSVAFNGSYSLSPSQEVVLSLAQWHHAQPALSD